MWGEDFDGSSSGTGKTLTWMERKAITEGRRGRKRKEKALILI